MDKIYDDEVLQEINEKANLFEYVSSSLDLEKRGGRYFAHCPKHIDKTPSLLFTPETNTYHCFSCGRSGGFIGYLINYEGLTFDEAVEKAAKIANVSLSDLRRSETMVFLKKLKTINANRVEIPPHPIIKASEYKKYKHEPADEWLSEGIEPDVMDLFGVRIDPTSNRIIYPVYDTAGNLINIKGRTRYENYKELKIPKYIYYYPVGVMDYLQGLNITLPYVQESGEIIIFESVKSVMKAYGWGYRNCASAEKHSLTKEQVNLLVKLKVNVVFAYDSDVSYSDNEARQSIDKLKRLTNVFIIKDPDDLLGGKEAKNAPVDLGKEIWEELYSKRKKVV